MAAYTSTTNGNWSNTATWGGSGPPGAGDTVTIASNVAVDVNTTVGRGNVTPPPSSPTVSATAGSTATSLPTGTYYVNYTCVNSSGYESYPSGSTSVSLTNGVSTPLITLPASLPSGVASYNIYLTNTNGSSGTGHLYASGVTGTTYAPTSASWTNGTTTYSAATAQPASLAIAYSTAAGYILTIDSGVTLTVLGSVQIKGPSGTAAQLVLSPGSKFILLPPSGVTYSIDCTDSGGSSPTITCNGTSSQPCTFETSTSSGGLNGYVHTWPAVGANQGILSASYTNFVNFGTSAYAGIVSHADTTSNTAVSITNCTFTGSNYLAVLGYTNSWDGNFTFTGNTFSSSVASTLDTYNTSYPFAPSASYGVGFYAPKTPVSGTRLVQNCSFDIEVIFNTAHGFQTESCYFGNGINTTGTPNWTWSKLDSCMIVGKGSSTPFIIPVGDVTNCFIFNKDTGTNLDDWSIVPSASANSATTINYVGNVFYSDADNPHGECMIVAGTGWATAPSVVVRYNIVLPNSYNGQASSFFFSCPDNTTTGFAVTVEHNTCCVEGAGCIENGDSQTASDPTNRWLSFRANLCWGTASTGVKVSYTAGTDGPITDAMPPAVANYNGGYLLASGSGTGTNSGNGYDGTYSVMPGANDVTGNPSFVNPSATLATWAAAQGQAATDAAATALVAANPSLVASSLLPYIRAAWRPTNPIYQTASYPGDTSAADAAGNAWPGGAPGIGAMAYLASFQPWLFGDQIESNGGG